MKYVCLSLLIVLAFGSGCSSIGRKSIEGEGLSGIRLTAAGGERAVRVGTPIQLRIEAILTDGGQLTTSASAALAGKRLSFRDFRLTTTEGQINFDKGVLVLQNSTRQMLEAGTIVVRAESRYHPGVHGQLTLNLDVAHDQSIELSGRNGRDGRSGSSGGDGRNGGHGADAPELAVYVSSFQRKAKPYVRVQVVDKSGKTKPRLVVIDPAHGHLTIKANGGRGGDGGNGGTGYRGRNAKKEDQRGGRGGNGGNGGTGGSGGRGSVVHLYSADSPNLAKFVTIEVAGGRAGRGGSAGSGGRGGNGSPNGSRGFRGHTGRRGATGLAGGIEEMGPAVAH